MLDRRATDLLESMDDPACDPQRLRNTYRQFRLVNRAVTGWKGVFDRRLRPDLQQGATLLDVGCGGGDLVMRLATWSAAVGKPLTITGIDPDRRAIEFATSAPTPAGVAFRRARAEELLEAGERFDYVVSNHLLHHLEVAELTRLLEVTAQLARRKAIHNDLRRHPFAYLGFALTRPLFRNSFIVTDGLRSIRRSFTPAELRPLLPDGWRLETAEPYRNLVILER